MGRAQEFHSSRSNELAEQIANRDWYHGTDQESAHAVAQSQRADFRGVQVHGPGLYVTPSKESASVYARAKAWGGERSAPTVQSGIPMTNNPVSVTHRQLIGLGQQFRDQHPHLKSDLPDAHLGNIALRQRGHDFMHVTEGVYGDPTDVGVVLRPNKWMALEDHDPV
jgi:hypothetical protein